MPESKKSGSMEFAQNGLASGGQVRRVTLSLGAPEVAFALLGDSPIDWKTVIGPADENMNDWRDAHFASVVEREVIRKCAGSA